MSNSVSSEFCRFYYLKYIKSEDLFVISNFIANKICDNINQTNDQLSIIEVSQIVAYIFWNKKMHHVVVANICKKLTTHENNNSDNNVNALLNINPPPNPDPDHN
jgi:hypothetical protein